MLKPRLIDYDIKVLIILGNQAKDDETRDSIRKILIDKHRLLNYSMIFLLNKFISSKDIMREVYAELIMIMMCERDLNLSSEMLGDIIKSVSLDSLSKYSSEVVSLELRDKCQNEFWNRVLEKEDNKGLIKKKYK